MPKFVLFVFLLLLSLGLKAQTWEIGGGAGGAGYMGDLNPNNPVKISGLSGSVFVKRNFDGYWSARLSYSLGQISAADSNSSNQQFRNRNLSFTTLLSEVSAIGEFNFMHYIPEAGRNKFTPYVFFGFAAVNYFPTTIYQGKRYSLREYTTEGESKPYSKTAFSFPYGAGVKYNLWGKFTIGADVGYRNPDTDYLDDVSGLYPAAGKSKAPFLTDRSIEKTGVYNGTPGTQRGDLRSRDTYFFSMITISYTFVTQRCYFER